MAYRIVVISSRAKLDYKMDYLVVRTEEKTSRVHLDEIAILIVETTAASLTAYLLAELSRKKIKVIFCDEKHNPYGELTPYFNSYDTSRKIREQVEWSADAKDFIWAEIVRAKLRGQLENLSNGHDTAVQLISSYMLNILPGDTSNREGHAAKVYFNALFGLDFTRSEENPINAALNYGYSLLLAAFNREIVSCGYITPLGIHHGNTFNQFNLACDLMEPFRPFIDAAVIRLPLENFGHKEKMHLADVLNHVVTIAGQNHHMLNAIHVYCLSVFNALSENDISLLRFPAYE